MEDEILFTEKMLDAGVTALLGCTHSYLDVLNYDLLEGYREEVKDIYLRMLEASYEK